MEPTIEQLIADLAAAKSAFDLANTARYDAVLAQEAAAEVVATAQAALDARIAAKISELNTPAV